MMRQTEKSELSTSISPRRIIEDLHMVDPDGFQENRDGVSNQSYSQMRADGYVKITLRCVETAVPTSDLLCRLPRIHMFNCSGADSLVDGRFTRTPGQMCVSLGCPRHVMCKAVCAELTTGPSRSCLQKASPGTQSCLWQTMLLNFLMISRFIRLTSDSLLSVAPPEQVRNACPPGGVLPTTRGTRLLRNHKTQAPSLRRLALLWIQFWSWIRLVWFGRRNSHSREVGKVRDLR